ncbi:MAG: hypothetical protein J0M10_04115 [Chitinophagales bacterium]|nr:hypothetical protein [Chitinophagales bacterium]
MGMDFLLPKILGLLLMAVWLYYSLREMYLYKHAEKVKGRITNVKDNPDSTSLLNKIITVEFFYRGVRETITYTITGTNEEAGAEIAVYINQHNIRHSEIKPRSTIIIFFNLFIPMLFIVLIIVSIVVAK